MIKAYLTISILLGIILLTQCAKEDGEVLESGLEHFPMEEGFYKIYQVDSIAIEAALEVNDSISFQLKEIHDSLYIDASGNLSMRIVRQKRSSEDDPWEVSDIWTAHRNGTSAQRVEENNRIVVLAFPPRDNLTWDINAFNIGEEWAASYDNLFGSTEVNEETYQNTVTVRFEDNINLVERESGYQIFAHDVGLVFSSVKILDLNGVVELTSEPSWEQITLGREITYKLLEYGLE
ncbi:MAG: hypothetical protein ACI8XB_000516 [Patiriisocius sp.]|jgi:hypothetical protein